MDGRRPLQLLLAVFLQPQEILIGLGFRQQTGTVKLRITRQETLYLLSGVDMGILLMIIILLFLIRRQIPREKHLLLIIRISLQTALLFRFIRDMFTVEMASFILLPLPLRRSLGSTIT